MARVWFVGEGLAALICGIQMVGSLAEVPVPMAETLEDAAVPSTQATMAGVREVLRSVRQAKESIWQRK